MPELKKTPLHDLHLRLGARMVPFAGWEMPLQYPAGVLTEHLQTRRAASLFDVSHMGQVILRGDGAAEALERLTPAAVVGLGEGRQRYALLTDPRGGILDDFMVANRGDDLLLVVNASRAEEDIAHLRAGMPGVEVDAVDARALMALQGPAAETALARLISVAAGMRFMDVARSSWEGNEIWISRSGYTGEDGYEISVSAAEAERFAEALLAMDEVEMAGLGARDSLRLEAGLCLYGTDIDETTSPVEADLAWSIQKARKPGGSREGGFPGADRVLGELQIGTGRRRVGLRPEGRAPMRAGVQLYRSEADAEPIGHVTSGGFGPSVEAPISMGYVPTDLAAPGTRLWADLRGRRQPVLTCDLPFRPANYKR